MLRVSHVNNELVKKLEIRSMTITFSQSYIILAALDTESLPIDLILAVFLRPTNSVVFYNIFYNSSFQ